MSVALMPQENWSIVRAQAAQLIFTFATVQGITGWALRFRLNKVDGTAVLTKTTAGGSITITDATNGVFKVALAVADTSTLDEKDYIYDVWRTDSGAEACLARGKGTLVQPMANLG